jgi:hypothetical protein
MPMRPAAMRIILRAAATESRSRPTSENDIPATSEYGVGRRSV